MPKFTGQNKKHINPRYFLNEGYSGSKYQSGLDPKLIERYQDIELQLHRLPIDQHGSPEHKDMERQYHDIEMEINKAGYEISNNGEIVNPHTGKTVGKKDFASLFESWKSMYHDAPSEAEFADEARAEKLSKDYVEALMPHADKILLRIIGEISKLPGEEGRFGSAPEEFLAELAHLSEGSNDLDVMEFLLKSVGESPEEIQDPDRYGEMQ